MAPKLIMTISCTFACTSCWLHIFSFSFDKFTGLHVCVFLLMAEWLVVCVFYYTQLKTLPFLVCKVPLYIHKLFLSLLYRLINHLKTYKTRVKVVKEDGGSGVLMLAPEEVGWPLQIMKRALVPHKNILVSFYLIFSFFHEKFYITNKSAMRKIFFFAKRVQYVINFIFHFCHLVYYPTVWKLTFFLSILTTDNPVSCSHFCWRQMISNQNCCTQTGLQLKTILSSLHSKIKK